MLDLFTGSGAAVGMLLRAVALGLTIAAGVSLGEMIIRPVQRPSDPAEAAKAEEEPAVGLCAPPGLAMPHCDPRGSSGTRPGVTVAA
jgi:hypothetical protein